jgi:hypothetical protein
MLQAGTDGSRDVADVGRAYPAQDEHASIHPFRRAAGLFCGHGS